MNYDLKPTSCDCGFIVGISCLASSPFNSHIMVRIHLWVLHQLHSEQSEIGDLPGFLCCQTFCFTMKEKTLVGFVFTILSWDEAPLKYLWQIEPKDKQSLMLLLVSSDYCFVSSQIVGETTGEKLPSTSPVRSSSITSNKYFTAIENPLKWGLWTSWSK